MRVSYRSNANPSPATAQINHCVEVSAGRRTVSADRADERLMRAFVTSPR
jgi:hypothetical protein